MNFTLAKLQIRISKFFKEQFAKLSADTIEWMATILLHCATLPSLLSLITGLSDRTPSLDIIAFIWGTLILLFIKAMILKDMLNVATIGFGFMVQSLAMAVILYR